MEEEVWIDRAWTRDWRALQHNSYLHYQSSPFLLCIILILSILLYEGSIL